MTEKKIRQKITKNTLILEIAERYPQLVEILVEKYGLHCLGCSLSAVETIEEGAMGHGLNRKEVEKMMLELNKEANRVDLKRNKKSGK
jgi:hybrid cluster-associated redox disulfide protein